MKTRTFVYRLFFTRSDDLDILQIVFLCAIAFFFVTFGMIASGHWQNVPPDVWEVFKWVFGVIALSGTPKWVTNTLIGYFTGRPVVQPDVKVTQVTNVATSDTAKEVG